MSIEWEGADEQEREHIDTWLKQIKDCTGVERSPPDMSVEEIDDYISHVSRIYLPSTSKTEVLPTLSPPRTPQPLVLPPRLVNPYTVYEYDPFGLLPPRYNIFLSKAADLVGVSLEGLGTMVREVERRVIAKAEGKEGEKKREKKREYNRRYREKSRRSTESRGTSRASSRATSVA
ncbi:hypothetical protein BT69DRAFT_1283298 [Atractiella rhizophila]|nr:hypothetical protein BT69DRAFT_1283298 [Atractiella rhizophila]